ncbi:hypothetical protein PSACC_02362 [Paramicrosporidium saccamoebae]|uniref:Uncharacterized protein n=1 Tax=Paramicrosporidium saccamoebae TaxID=1246581 RepID=A0A2H9TJB5_9FUNG|nr:hypothetical protein PSACC_02362 [Paramicrosporidium saccamoebae]
MLSHDEPLKASPPKRVRLGRPPRVKAEAINEICALVDDRLFLRYMSAFTKLQSTVETASVRLFAENAILWNRQLSNSTSASRSNSARSQCQTPLDSTRFVALIFDSQDIHAHIKSGGEEAVLEFLSRHQRLIPSTYDQVYFLIIGGKALSSRLASEINKEFRRAVLTGTRLVLTPTKKLPTWDELEQALWLAGLENGVRIQFLDHVDQLPDHLLEMTKCVAWEPYGHRHETGNFCVVASKRCGTTLSGTWRRILEEIGRVTPTVATAIAASFPTMDSLLRRYNESDQMQGEMLLADIPLGGNRTLGPSLSKRIYRVLTCNNPNQTAYL